MQAKIFSPNNERRQQSPSPVIIYNEYEKWKILRKVANELEKVWLGWIWQEGKSRKTEVLENAVWGNEI